MTRTQKRQFTSDIQGMIRTEFEALKQKENETIQREVVTILFDIFKYQEAQHSEQALVRIQSDDSLFGYSDRSADRLRRVYLWLIAVNLTVIFVTLYQIIFCP